MKRVVVNFGDVVRFYKNVTKVQFFAKDGFLTSKIIIFQKNKKTVINTCDINGFEVVE